MQFSFEIKDKLLVSEEECKELEWLRFKDGYIWPAFNKLNGHVILAKQNDVIIAWAFIFKIDKDKLNTFYIYVKKQFRRKGIGSTIYKIALLFNNNKIFKVSKWSNQSQSFYEQLDN